ncbi:MAG: hypothetical protein VR64_06210 [Desulfatitalea sp. BRH_c12]|nr:MAG: hypothetical protein VR64_06210 [Desulfatitalea sp. BRH_c12]
MNQPTPKPAWRRINRLAWLLDNSIRLPGVNYRIGLDPLLGLVPGIGEALGAVLSMYIIAEGARGGLPRSILLRMGFNVALEVVIGAIPLVGDLFDMTWKANARNVRLIEKYAASPRESVVSSTLLLWGIMIVLMLMVAAVFYVGILIVSALWTALTG